MTMNFEDHVKRHPIPQVNKALQFASVAHKGQVRKYSGEPYINHPIAVAKIVESVPHDKNMIAAALLHDVVEDCEVSLEQIEQQFGADIASLVENLTDVSKPEDGNRKIRKAIDREHSGNASPRAASIKLADMIHNSEDIIKNDPNFAKVYIAEKKLLLQVLSHGDYKLHRIASNIVNNFEAKRGENEAS